MKNDLVERAAAALAPNGLILRGGFNFDADEAPPFAMDGEMARSVLLVGNGGAAYWQQFSQWRAQQPAEIENPLDSWSRQVIEAVAVGLGGRAIMPNDRPFAPFQQWAKRAEGLKSSPLGMLMHPQFGLWHAWRGALLFDVEILIHPPVNPIHLCDVCSGKPCLNSCPADVFSGAGYDYEACVSHVRGPSGEMCRQQGCIARNSCPQARQWRYPPQVQAFHQKAFAGL